MYPVGECKNYFYKMGRDLIFWGASFAQLIFLRKINRQ